MKKTLITIAIFMLIVVVDVVFVVWVKGLPLIAVSLQAPRGTDGTLNTYIHFTPVFSTGRAYITFAIDDTTKTENSFTMDVSGPLLQNNQIDEGFSIGVQRKRRLPSSEMLQVKNNESTVVTINYGVITDTMKIHREKDELIISPNRWNLFSTVKNGRAPVFPTGYIVSRCRFILMSEKNEKQDEHCVNFFNELASRATAVDSLTAPISPLIRQQPFRQWWRYSGSLNDLEDMFEKFKNPNYELSISNGERSLNYFYVPSTDNDTVYVGNPLNSPESFRIDDGGTLTTVELPLKARIAIPQNWRQDPYGVDSDSLRTFLTQGFNPIGFLTVPVEEFNVGKDDLFVAYVEQYVLSRSQLGKPKPLNEIVVIDGREWHRVAAVNKDGKIITDPKIITLYDNYVFVIELTVDVGRSSMWQAAEDIAARVIFP